MSDSQSEKNLAVSDCSRGLVARPHCTRPRVLGSLRHALGDTLTYGNHDNTISYRPNDLLLGIILEFL